MQELVDEPSGRLLYLFADEPDVVLAAGCRWVVARLNGLLKWKSGAMATGETVELHVRAPSGTERIIIDELTIYPPPATGVVSSWAHGVPMAELGVHMVYWQVGGDRSATIEVRVTDVALPPGTPLTVAAIPSVGIAGEPDLIARLVNATDRAIDRAIAFLTCTAIVDGERRRFPAAHYDGAAELPPGASMWFLFALDDFVPRTVPGDHDVQMCIAEYVSTAVRVTILPR